MTKLRASCLLHFRSFSLCMTEKFLPELKCLLKLAWPIILMNLFRFLNPTISVIMCGHLTKKEFDAASLANALINVFGVSVDLGFSTACDTLFARIYGSRNRHKLGLMLQKAILVMTILYFILGCFHLNIEPVLILLQQDVEISRLAAKYVVIYLPGLFFDFQFLAIARYLQNQNVVYPMMVSSFIGCIFNVVFQYIAIYQLKFGIEASALIQGLSCCVMFSLQLVHLIKSKIYKPTWQGIEFLNALEGWGIFFKLGIPGIIMLGVEEWMFEIGNFISGALSDVQLGAQSIAFQIEMICYTLHSGLSIAVAIRAGQFLGANKPKEASLTGKAIILIELSLSTFTATIILAFRNYLPFVFTNDEEIITLAQKILLILVPIQFLDAGCSTASGIFRACGKQVKGAIVMICSCYLLGIPVGIILIYVVGTDIQGFWIGLVIALVAEVSIFFIVIFRIDWNNEALKAQSTCKDTNIVSPIDKDKSYEKYPDTLEDSKLLKSESDSEEEEHESVLKTVRKNSKITGRRSIGGISEVLIDSCRDYPNLRMNYKTMRKTILKRITLTTITLILFCSSIFVKIYLPEKYYIPCISNQTNLPLHKHYPFCNDSIYQS